MQGGQLGGHPHPLGVVEGSPPPGKSGVVAVGVGNKLLVVVVVGAGVGPGVGPGTCGGSQSGHQGAQGLNNGGLSHGH